MRHWTSAQVAQAAGAGLEGVADAAPGGGPVRAVIDSRQAGPGDLFVGLPGSRVDGGRFAAAALEAGAWGAIVAEDAAVRAPGRLLRAADPLQALQSLARAWRRELDATVVGVTGSTGKTSTKDILAAMLRPSLRCVASERNFNTEIGLPLAILGAPLGTEVLVLELAMRGSGQIAELAAICEPNVGVIVNIGPAHLELLGSLEAIAAAKAELIAALAPGSVVVVPAGEPLLDPHLGRDDLRHVRFGNGGDVRLGGVTEAGVELHLADGRRVTCEPGFRARHQLSNLLAAAAAAEALEAPIPSQFSVSFSAGRGERLELPGDILVLDDCYNANPMSMRAALEELARAGAGRRRVAVLGDMLELGPGEVAFHRQLGEHARAAGVSVLLAVGPRARETAGAFGAGAEELPDAAAAAHRLPELLAPGDSVLIKGSRGVGLEVVAQELMRPAGAAT